MDTFGHIWTLLGPFWTFWKPFREQLQKYLVVEKSIGHSADIVISIGYVFQAHKIVLAASLSFFNKVLRVNPHPHPLIYVPDITLDSLNSIIELLYSGQVIVSEDNLESFLEAARLKLKIPIVRNSQINSHCALVSVPETINSKLTAVQ